MVKCGPVGMRACGCIDVNRQMVGFSRVSQLSKDRIMVRHRGCTGALPASQFILE